ncbi:MAG TPA: twin-arginine translocase subunit TatC [Acidimicrobiales bacterium]|nr:twin-arginine translocase subunit TatC [Acidimicrobiales bacterium]
MEHLTELRRRVIVSILAVSAGAVVAFIFYPAILRWFTHPYCAIHPPSCKLYVTGPLDALGLRLQIAGYGGLVLALPVVLYQLWRFITPGLRDNEKRYSLPFVLVSLVFFGAGGYVAWLTFPHALRWLTSIGGPSLVSIYSPANYMKLIVLLMVVFGVAFEFPVVLVALELARVVTPATLMRWWRRAVMIIFVFAAVATPSSDPFSMLALALPMTVFYFLAVLVGRLFAR